MRITKFLNAHSLLPVRQSEFRKGYSCTTALGNVLVYICTALNNNKMSVPNTHDYRNKFHTGNCKILTTIFLYLGFSCKFSRMLPLTAGVLLESVFGPVLYAVYTSSIFATCGFVKSAIMRCLPFLKYCLGSKRTKHRDLQTLFGNFSLVSR